MAYSGKASGRWIAVDHLHPSRPLPDLQSSTAQHLVGVLGRSQLHDGEDPWRRRGVHCGVHRHHRRLRS